jgi:hypothetical protein
MDLSLPLALSATSSTLGFILIFAVLFPVIVQGLILYAAAQAANERQQNLDDFDGVAER